MATRGFLAVTCLLLTAGCAAGPGGPSSAAPPPPRLQVTGGTTTGPLTLDRVEITFGSGFGSAAVERGQRLVARAVVRFSGNGLFRATWLVDGRPVDQVQHLVTFGNTLTLEVGQGPTLPTFEPGDHALTLRIDEPAGGLAAPEVRYFVQ